jgi:hypothetical protein
MRGTVLLAFAVLTWAMMASGAAAPSYPWDLKGRTIPAYRVIATDNPIKDEYMVTYTVVVCADKASARDDIKLMGEKIIENLPPHNMAIICFLADPSERSKDWTIARIWWGHDPASPRDDSLPEAGDYSKNVMKIAMKGQSLPGDVVEKY